MRALSMTVMWLLFRGLFFCSGRALVRGCAGLRYHPSHCAPHPPQPMARHHRGRPPLDSEARHFPGHSEVGQAEKGRCSSSDNDGDDGGGHDAVPS
ncbi:hypothetical protein NOF04DRAFT_1313292 [Fusarium oxysporum II5]|nr:hypothetical protein NOF04DRAFT_1313292 [Fusarium oxysporum II5]